jgi:uncharacterized metal-binding protein YceD (DUF177 family)
MGRLGIYKVELKGMTDSHVSYEWFVDSTFFSFIDGEEVQKGKVTVQLEVTKNTGLFNFQFVLKGYIFVPCDRCLDDMRVEIDTTGTMKVRLGADFADDGDILVIPEQDGSVNIAWYIYEFITLAIPLKHVHAPGKCNKDMVSKLNRHISAEAGDDDTSEVLDNEAEEQNETDPRWNDLEKLLDIDNE